MEMCLLYRIIMGVFLSNRRLLLIVCWSEFVPAGPCEKTYRRYLWHNQRLSRLERIFPSVRLELGDLADVSSPAENNLVGNQYMVRFFTSALCRKKHQNFNCKITQSKWIPADIAVKFSSQIGGILVNVTWLCRYFCEFSFAYNFGLL